MRDAVDFMSAPDPGLLKQLDLDALPYTGNARPSAEWFAQMQANGLPVRCMIQETISTRSQQGFQAGVYDCQFAEQRSREVNPDVQSIAVVVSDGNGADRWDASQYGAGWASVATLRFFPYGALGVTASFLAGAKGSPRSIDGEWVPETWGAGRLISQVVGASPVPNTDLNRVHADYTGGSPIEEDDVKLYQSPSGIFVVDGLNTVDLAPSEVGAYEFTTGGPPVPIEQASADILHAVSARLQSEGVAAVAVAASGFDPAPTKAKLAAARQDLDGAEATLPA